MATGPPPDVGTALEGAVSGGPDGAVPVLPRTLPAGIGEAPERFHLQPVPVPRAGAGRRTCPAVREFVAEVVPVDG